MNALYRAFVQIVDSGTLSQAAAQLHLTQPTLTRQIHQLERGFGVQLFDRIGRRLVLNRAGERVYHTAKQVLSLEQKLQDELGAFTNPDIGTVYLGAGLTPSIYLLPPLLAEYRVLHPGVRFQVRTGSSLEVQEMILGREVDMGIVTTPTPRPDIAAVPLLPDELLLVVAPTHPLAGRTACTFLAAAQYDMVSMHSESGLRRIVATLAEQQGVNLKIAMETDSLESINRLVQNGIGTSVLPRSSVQDDITAGRLVQVAVSDTDFGSRMITLITRADGALPASAAQFAKQLPERCRALHSLA